MDRCWAMCRAYDEEVLIPYWVRHYRQFCERVIVYVDGQTTDRTVPRAQREGADVRVVESMGLDDVGFVTFAQERYKEAYGQAEWCIWVDADELLYHPKMAKRLDKLRREAVTLPRVHGYQMVSESPPSGDGLLTDEIRRGVPAAEYGKPCIFSPELDMHWTPGKHDARVIGPAVVDDGSDPLKLLHYRYLGEAWHVARNARNYARIDERNRAARHGREVYPEWDGTYSAAWFKQQVGRAEEVI